MQRGLTLVELLITIVVSAILLSVAAPAFRDFVLSSRISSISEQLYKTLHMARSEAIRRGTTVTICGSKSYSDCDGADWAAGWIVWVDSNQNAIVDADEILNARNNTGTSAVLSNGEGVLSITFLSNGFLNMPPGNRRTFTVCDDRSNEQGRQVVVQSFGYAANYEFTCS